MVEPIESCEGRRVSSCQLGQPIGWMETLCERKAELAVGAVEREVIRCVKATKSLVRVDHGRLGLVDKRVRHLQDAVGLTGAVSAVEVEQKTLESVEVVLAACLERFNNAVQFWLTGWVEGVLMYIRGGSSPWSKFEAPV